MKKALLFLMFSFISLVWGQQTNVSKTEKNSHSIIERKIADKQNDDVAKNNVHNILLKKNNSFFVLQNLDRSEIQKNVDQVKSSNINFNNTINGVYASPKDGVHIAPMGWLNRFDR